MDDILADNKTVPEQVKNATLQPPLADLVDEYDDRIGIRTEYLWKWLYTSFPFVTLSCVPEHERDAVCTQKTILSMYITLVDDLGENLKDGESFREATKIPFSHQQANVDRSDVRTDYLEFTQRVWKSVESRLSERMTDSKLRSLFDYDLRLALNAMDYERLANEHPEIMNTTEILTYTPHNMVMLAAADLDLCYSPEFVQSDLAAVRETVVRGQQLVRISNWTSTWEREIAEADFTSAVFTEAIDHGIVSPSELEDGLERDSEQLAEAIRHHGIESRLLEDWENRYSNLEAELPAADSVDLEAFLDGVKRVRRYHMASKGHK